MYAQQYNMLTADPVTTAWLKASVDVVFGYPALVRFSWQTTTRMLEDTACAVHWYVTAASVWHGLMRHCPRVSCKLS